jgi:hypothetical protein
MKVTFSTIILGFGNNTGIEVPAECIEKLGHGKKPPVTVSIEKYTYKIY